MRLVIDMQGAQTESRFRGIGRYTLSLVQAIVRRGEEHEIILALSGLFPETIEIIRETFDGLLPQENIRVWYAPSRVRECEAGNDWRREVAEYIREAFLASLQPDVVLVSSLFEGYIDDAVTSIAALPLEIPTAVILYDLIPLLNPDEYLKPTPDYARYYQRKIEHLKHAVHCLAISEAAAQEVRRALSLNYDLITNISTASDAIFRPLEITEFTQRQLARFKISQPFILNTGGADVRKNLPRLIRAYSRLPKALLENYHLVLAGKMPEGNIAEFKNIAKAAGLGNDRLCFTGYVSDKELVQLYNSCALFVFPSLHEGFGLPVLEAMSCGAPVIGANTSSVPEVVGCPDALFDPYNEADITLKLVHVLQDQGFRASLREHGLQRAKHFSWEESARRAVHALETAVEVRNKSKSVPPTFERRPTLAYVSPLPPERTGIADYSAELLPSLSEHYDIELVVDQERVDHHWLRQYGKLRDAAWLRAHTGVIDRVLYQVGNSPFHQYMLPLMREIPGTVVLHDFYLSDLMAWLEMQAGIGPVWTNALYESHGYGAVRERYMDPDKAKREFPANWFILRHAQGVIFTSKYSLNLADKWYGYENSSNHDVLPLFRCPAENPDKVAARQELGFTHGDFIICSFGYLDTCKLNHRLLRAWLESALARDRHCRLIFVGENHGGDYGRQLLELICRSGMEDRIHITGFVSPETFRQYLTAADIAVQLRTHSRGEASAAVLDCMNYSLPLIVNAHGSMAELDYQAVYMLNDNFDNSELINALELLWRDPERRKLLGERGQQIVRRYHSPAETAKRYVRAIERFYNNSTNSSSVLVSSIASKCQHIMDNKVFCDLAKDIASSLPYPRPSRRLFLDVTATCNNDLRTGIERVVRALILALIEDPPCGYRIEPIYLSSSEGKWFYRFARRYTLGLLNCPNETLDDEVVDPEFGDVLLGLDLSGDVLIQAHNAGLFANLINRGITIHWMVHDLLPVIMPNVFPPGSGETHSRWLTAISTFNGAICVSRTVAADLVKWRENFVQNKDHRRPYRIGWSHHGADVKMSAPSVGTPENAPRQLEQIKANPSFLMVGTIEPRKGYLQTIDAFTQLWLRDININLVIVGKEGWKGLPENMRRDIPLTIDRIKGHRELDKRLFWLDGISDEYLSEIYEASSCLIMSSYGEGFGLPLIEAAQHDLPIICRDLPVFREVAGPHAFYFTGTSPNDLSRAISEWLSLHINSEHPKSFGMTWLTWKQSAKSLRDVVMGDKPAFQDVAETYKLAAKEEHLNLIHSARTLMVSRLLPAGDIILDLGGANCPLYKMGYSHHFKRLYLIDLPPDERHEMYKDLVIDEDCKGGEVVIRYTDMTELEAFPDNTVDLVWSGQSIEHVPIEKGKKMCDAAFRVLKQGGSFCLDTPNRLLTEIHTRDIGGGFIHPEHYIEYYPEQLKQLLKNSGFEIRSAFGVCEMNNTLFTGTFCYEDFALGSSISDRVTDCYIQFYHCIKP